jgi:hypothetical protein
MNDMKTTFQIALGLVLVLVSGCKPAAPAPAPVRWEYSKFKFHEPDSRTFSDTVVWCYVQFSDGNFHWYPSNHVSDTDSLLNAVGNYGWDLAWSDGSNFIVKRPRDVFTNGVFIVGEAFIPKTAK